ncbi:hypothetical protein EDD17DRAFT_1839346 [Pisolithus thermaeus]|nr:hypothetical protein EDD17DRAFT_1839346 [Pisolithus thermaeus]
MTSYICASFQTPVEDTRIDPPVVDTSGALAYLVVEVVAFTTPRSLRSVPVDAGRRALIHVLDLKTKVPEPQRPGNICTNAGVAPRFVTSSGGGTPAYGLSPFIVDGLDGQMGWMVDLEGISDSNIFRATVSTTPVLSPRRSSIRIVKFETFCCYYARRTSMRKRDGKKKKQNRNPGARSAEEPNTQEWKITYPGAHDAVNEVSPYDTFAYLVRVARLQVAALPNRNYEEWRITYAYVRTKIMIGRVDACSGAEDAWGDQYMEFERPCSEVPQFGADGLRKFVVFSTTTKSKGSCNYWDELTVRRRSLSCPDTAVFGTRLQVHHRYTNPDQPKKLEGSYSMIDKKPRLHERSHRNQPIAVVCTARPSTRVLRGLNVHPKFTHAGDVDPFQAPPKSGLLHTALFTRPLSGHWPTTRYSLLGLRLLVRIY